MKSAWLGFLPALMLGVVASGGCGATSRSDHPQSSGASQVSGDAGTAGRAGAGGDSAGGAASREDCEAAACGPQLGLPNWTCADGSLGGPTGRCIRGPGGTCGWEVLECPAGGEGGSSAAGGQANMAGAPGAGGAVTDACGGCDLTAPEICVYQAGGPGPSRYVCAPRGPCAAVGACSCIEGQGSCHAQLMGDPPSYCVCDNGLD
jgi:hypothetical protein